MKDLKIGTRLAVGFALMITATGAFGAFAYINEARIDQTADQLERVTLPAAYLSDDLRSSVQRQYALFQQFLTTADVTEAKPLVAAITSERTRSADLMSKLEVISTNEKLQSPLHSLKSARDEFQASYDGAINLMRTVSDKSGQQALDLDARTIRQAYTKFTAAADAMVNVSRSLAEAQPRDIDASSSATSSRIVLFVGATVLLSILMSLLLIRSITQPLLEAIDVLDQVANGDMTRRATVTVQDEIGQLLSGLNRHLDNQWSAAGLAERLAEGDFAVHVGALSDRDVLGRALVRMRNNLQSSVEVVERLAVGDFTVQPRVTSDTDKLGNAIVHLRTALLSTSAAAKTISEGGFEVQTALVPTVGPLGQSLLRIRDQLQASTRLAAKLSEGELIALENSSAFNNPLGQSLVSLHGRLMASISVMQKISEGDLSMQPPAYSGNDIFGSTLTRMLERLRRVAAEVVSSGSQMAGVSLELIATAARLSQSSSEHTATAAETAFVLGGMADSLRQSADQSDHTHTLASAVAQDGRLSSEAISQAVLAIKEVAGRINLLDEIARKSDMLTLAAAVEAARAGEHGASFGVVASELRKVSERSQTAAAEIQRLSLGGVQAAESAGEILARLVPRISKTAELAREMATASAEQNCGATRANQAVQQLDLVIQQSVLASQQMAETAGQLASHANALQSTLSFFKLAESLPTDAQVVSTAPAVLQKTAGV